MFDKRCLFVIFSISLILGFSSSASLNRGTTSDQDEAIERYLRTFGYLGSENTKTTADRAAAIRRFQQFFGLNVTGEVDGATWRLMQKPRCGKPDADGARKVGASKAAGLGKWEKNDLTYRILSYPNAPLTSSQTDNIIKTSLNTWGDVTPLKFQRTSSKPDIDIRFVSGDHGDGSPFDGPQGVLAHAFFPSNHGSIRGDVHFDKDENFETGTSNSRGRTSLQIVAIHEFGHSLGLDHSNDRNSIMYPFIGIPYKLNGGDVQRIQALYGKNTNPVPSPPTPNPPSQCQSGTLDAVTSPRNNYNDIRLFRGNKYFLADYTKIKDTKDVSSVWSQRTSLDAASYLRTSKGESLYLFKGGRVLEVNQDNQAVKEMSFSELLKDVPDNITLDAVFNHPHKDNQIYVFAGTQYYRLTSQGNHYQVDTTLTYPKSVSVWELPMSTIDAATLWKKKLYFFKGEDYYRYRDDFKTVADGYPRKTKRYWLYCK